MGDTAGAAVVSCATCAACCCRLEVMLMAEDDVPEALTVQDRWGGWVMRRLADGWCAAVDRHTHRCTIYACRPTVCRDLPVGDSECLQARVWLAVSGCAGSAGAVR